MTLSSQNLGAGEDFAIWQDSILDKVMNREIYYFEDDSNVE